ncbi:glycoside hydrolase family 15 protein [Rhodococcus sp. NPDC003322]
MAGHDENSRGGGAIAVDLGHALFAPRVLREYALLADGERGVLVGAEGECAWMCAPQWDSESVFAALIGGAGGYAITPAARSVWGGYYEPGSLIWRSRWVTDVGIVECRDALAYPGDRHRAVLLRRVLAVQGDARVRVVLDCRARFGHHRMARLECRHGRWTARAGDLRMRWSGAEWTTRRDSGPLDGELTVPEGRHHDFVLELADRPLGERPTADELWETTEHTWAQAVPPVSESIAPDDARHAHAVLRGLTSTTGAMVAAATMSLPERAEQGRNYDYRYAWIRDQCFAGQAVAVTGAHGILDDAVRFVGERLLADGPGLEPAYTVDGGRVPDESDLGLPGYPGGGARTGNWITDQFQLDTFGEALLLFGAAGRLERLDTDHWHAVEQAVAAIERRWAEPDAGIWELHDARWAHSRLTCAAGLRGVAGIASRTDAARWTALADALVADTAATCTHPSGRWQRANDDPRVDCALLAAAIRGAVPEDDPRSVATYDAVRAELAHDGYVYRFRQDERPLASSEGAFLLCGFLMALAAHQQGHESEAMRWFERNRAACGPPGLFTEEYDVQQRQLRGNLPQAFVHALMLEASARLAQPWTAVRHWR